MNKKDVILMTTGSTIYSFVLFGLFVKILREIKFKWRLVINIPWLLLFFLLFLIMRPYKVYNDVATKRVLQFKRGNFDIQENGQIDFLDKTVSCPTSNFIRQ